jgi:hypothetical protein
METGIQETRVCQDICKRELPLTSFAPNRKKSCKDCHSIQVRLSQLKKEGKGKTISFENPHVMAIGVDKVREYLQPLKTGDELSYVSDVSSVSSLNSTASTLSCSREEFLELKEMVLKLHEQNTLIMSRILRKKKADFACQTEFVPDLMSIFSDISSSSTEGDDEGEKTSEDEEKQLEETSETVEVKQVSETEETDVKQVEETEETNVKQVSETEETDVKQVSETEETDVKQVSFNPQVRSKTIEDLEETIIPLVNTPIKLKSNIRIVPNASVPLPLPAKLQTSEKPFTPRKKIARSITSAPKIQNGFIPHFSPEDRYKGMPECLKPDYLKTPSENEDKHTGYPFWIPNKF